MLFKQRGLSTIVEIGCMRMALKHPIDETHHECCCDGHSSVLWARTGAQFVTVDVNPKAIQTTTEALRGFQNATIRQMDGIQYLRERAQAPYSSIDLLFLDAWDVDISDCAEQHVRAYDAARPKLHDRSIVMIDDTDVGIVDGKLQPVQFPGGKGRLLVPYMLTQGWRVYSSGRCAVMIRG
jgi:hypothetical protein